MYIYIYLFIYLFIYLYLSIYLSNYCTVTQIHKPINPQDHSNSMHPNENQFTNETPEYHGTDSKDTWPENCIHLVQTISAKKKHAMHTLRCSQLLHLANQKNDVGKYDGQACPAIVYSHILFGHQQSPLHKIHEFRIPESFVPDIMDASVFYFVPAWLKSSRNCSGG